MKQFNAILLTVIAIFSYQMMSAQTGILCQGNKGPNLLGARGSFSAPYIKVNNEADAVLQNGTNTYSPTGNVGSKLEGCANPTENFFPCSDYIYTSVKDGMEPELTYSILKVIGDENGSNPIHSPKWKATDHTGDGGYFLAVNGAPDTSQSPIFYQIKSIPVCAGSVYEFSAWVINMMPPGGDTSAAPKISFIVNNTDTIAQSLHIPYDNKWYQVGGQFTASGSTVDLKVVNSTFVAGGNDLGLDDISIRVCQSQITVDGPITACEGNTVSPVFTINDPTALSIPGGSYTYYKWEVSRDSKVTWNDLGNGRISYNSQGKASLTYPLTNVSLNPDNANASGNVYRLVVATKKGNLANPECIYFNDYTLAINTDVCDPSPVTMVSFTGAYSDGVATLNWSTSQEFNNDRFELLRSTDGQNFELAATIAGSGNSATTKNYRYQDRASVAGNSLFYKLKQIDVDGRFTFSNIIKLSIGSTNSAFQIFPNPATNDFTASFNTNKIGKATLLVRSTNGQTVVKKAIDVTKGNNSIFVNVSQLKTGMYYISIINEEINYNAKLQKL
ncbi:MAG: T9SS type A sorting domain-containing protein [Ginsengibacter sp.]